MVGDRVRSHNILVQAGKVFVPLLARLDLDHALGADHPIIIGRRAAAAYCSLVEQIKYRDLFVTFRGLWHCILLKANQVGQCWEATR